MQNFKIIKILVQCYDQILNLKLSMRMMAKLILGVKVKVKIPLLQAMKAHRVARG
jgi:hypothetical protein